MSAVCCQSPFETVGGGWGHSYGDVIHKNTDFSSTSCTADLFFQLFLVKHSDSAEGVRGAFVHTDATPAATAWSHFNLFHPD